MSSRAGISLESDGFAEFDDMMKDYLKSCDEENAKLAIEDLGRDLVNDLLKLPSPRSKINKPTYTHLIDTFGMAWNKDELEVGWGKYYGPMVEHGHKGVSAEPHLLPTWERNKESYYDKALKRLNLK